MNAPIKHGELVLSDDFFAPVSADMIDELVGQYKAVRQRIDAVSAFVNDAINGAVIHYFIEGNCDENNGRFNLKRSASHLFDSAGAVAALNSAYWSKAMHLTDVLNYMPQARRDEWHKSIREQTCPEFEAETVRNTLGNLLNMRSQFLAERVDGIFRGLSGEHVTNSPAAFGKRMILAHVLNEWHSESYSKCGLINDLRCVIAKFMGRDEPGYGASAGLIRALKGRWGEWVTVDGCALRIRLYKKGTAHLEVHPDMAWRLNATLAHLHPMAIPSEFRTKPKRKPKDVVLMQRPLPFAVIDLLASAGTANRYEKTNDFRQPYKSIKIENSITFGFGAKDKHAFAEAEKVLEYIGGVKQPEGWFQFDYRPHEILEEIVASGCIPDHKAHQFYPTPESVARRAVELACIGDMDECLEPSAGIGGLADFMPKGLTQCVEVSALHCRVLEAKQHCVVNADFLSWSNDYAFDRIVMNPPYDQGRWKAHLEHGSGMLADGGRLVAILPASAKSKDVLFAGQWSLEWSEVFENEFAGTSMSVVILSAKRA